MMVPSSSVASPRIGVERGDAVRGQQLDSPALVPALRLGQDEVVGQVVPEQLLAQRRPVVRQRGLLADEEDPPVEPLAA